MYSLRIFTETRKDEKTPWGGYSTTYDIGGSYSVYKNGGTSEFDEIMAKEYPEMDKSKIRGIILTANQKTFFIELPTNTVSMSYFIMTERGSTLEKL